MYKEAQLAAEPRPVVGGKVEVDLLEKGQPRTELVEQLLVIGIPAWGAAVEAAYAADARGRAMAAAKAAAQAAASSFYFEWRVNKLAQRLLPGGSEREVSRREGEVLDVAFNSTQIQAAELRNGTTDQQLIEAERQVFEWLYGVAPAPGSPPGTSRIPGARPPAGSLGGFFLEKFLDGATEFSRRGWAGNAPNQIPDGDIRDLLFGITGEQIRVLRARVAAGDIGKRLSWEVDGPLDRCRAGIPERAGAAPGVAPAVVPAIAPGAGENHEGEAVHQIRSALRWGAWQNPVLPETAESRLESYMASVDRRERDLMEARKTLVVDVSKGRRPGALTGAALSTGLKGGELGVVFAQSEVGTEVWGLYRKLVELCGYDLSLDEVRIRRDVTFATVFGGEWMQRCGFAGLADRRFLDWASERPFKPGQLDDFRSLLLTYMAERLGESAVGRLDEKTASLKVVDAAGDSLIAFLHGGWIETAARNDEGYPHPLIRGKLVRAIHPEEVARRQMKQYTEGEEKFVFSGVLREFPEDQALWRLVPKDVYVHYILRKYLSDKTSLWDRVRTNRSPVKADFQGDIQAATGDVRGVVAWEMEHYWFPDKEADKAVIKVTDWGWASKFQTEIQRAMADLGVLDERDPGKLTRTVQERVLLLVVAAIGLETYVVNQREVEADLRKPVGRRRNVEPINGWRLRNFDRLVAEQMILGLEAIRIEAPEVKAGGDLPGRGAMKDISVVSDELRDLLFAKCARVTHMGKVILAEEFFDLHKTREGRGYIYQDEFVPYVVLNALGKDRDRFELAKQMLQLEQKRRREGGAYKDDLSNLDVVGNPKS